MFSCVVVVFLLSSTIALERPAVTTKLGSITGYHKTSYDGRTYSSFEGIPYGKPPVGQLRFEAPVEADPWKKPLDANKTYECPQMNFSFQHTGSEDCLYLNVYVPKETPNPNDNLQVIAHIHGGGFVSGNANRFGPVFFMDRDVIFVNFNYRLGALGFLSTEDDVVPGNNGLKDQNLALKWIQDNIRPFGGNPNSVTLTGGSAGAGSVHFHYFSKMSKGLFHRGISQTGTAFAPWAIQRGALERAKALSVLLGCSDTTTSRTFIDCLKEKPSSEEIILESPKLNSPATGFPVAIFSPVVEVKSDSAFLTDYPKKLLISGDFNDLPWITSMCTDEGGFGIYKVYKEFDELDGKFNQLAHYYLDYNHTTCDCDKEDIAQKIREHYFGTQKIGEDSYRSLMQLFGDRLFGVNLERSAKIQASVAKSKIYSYIYGYKNSFVDDYMKSIFDIDLELGVGHVEDALLLYDKRIGNYLINSVLSETDVQIKDMMVDMFVSFATSDVPKINGLTVEDVANSHGFTYLSIKGTNDIKMNVTKELTPIKFWESLPIVEDEQLLPSACNKCELKKKL